MDPTLIVITGAASGIGFQLAHYFEKKNLPLILLDLNGARLRALFASKSNVHLVAGDVSKEDTWQGVIAKAKEIHLPISHQLRRSDSAWISIRFCAF